MYGSGSFACANKSMYTELDMKHRLAHLPESPLLADMEKHINPSNVIWAILRINPESICNETILRHN